MFDISCRYKANEKVLKQNFYQIGTKKKKKTDDPSEKEYNEENENKEVLVHESDSVFSLWVTGRQNCDGMAILIKV